MYKLNKSMLDLILNNFFKNENHIGWYCIASDLVNKGKCLVESQGENIFAGLTVSKFITLKNLPKSNYQLYEFDLDAFLNSNEFNEIHKREILKMEKQLIEIRYLIANLQLT